MTIPEGVDPYSPYVPENMPKLEVGMRVRWRFSSECPYRCEKCGMEMHHHLKCDSCQDETWATGVITFIGNYIQRSHALKTCMGRCIGTAYHDYFITIHKRGDGRDVGFWAAASELIPVEVD